MKIRFILTASIAALCLTPASVRADQSLLSGGDLVFLAAKSDDPDSFSFSPLVNIEAGTYIFFTDNGRTTTSAASGADWRFSAGDLALGEGIYTYVAPSDLAAGSVVTLTAGVLGVSFSTSGDNILAYQGSLRQPSFVAGVGWASTNPFITTGTPTSNNSYLPSSLAIGSSAVELIANIDNTGYTGPTTGTEAVLQAALNDLTNWTNNDTAGVTPPGGLIVSGAASAIVGAQKTIAYNFGYTAGTYHAGPSIDPTKIAPGTFGVMQGLGTVDSDGGNGLSNQDWQVAGGFSLSLVLNLLTDQAVGMNLAIDAGEQFDLSRVEFAYQRDANGPKQLALFGSLDGFATSFQLGSTINLTNTNWSFFEFNDPSSTLYSGTLGLRIYGWEAGSAPGVLEIDEIVINGSFNPVPEPSTMVTLLGGLGMLTFTQRLRRRR